MKIYIASEKDYTPPTDFVQDPPMKKTFKTSTEYQGKEYKLGAVYSKILDNRETAKAIACIVASCFLPILFVFEKIRDSWTSIFHGKEIQAVYIEPGKQPLIEKIASVASEEINPVSLGENPSTSESDSEVQVSAAEVPPAAVFPKSEPLALITLPTNDSDTSISEKTPLNLSSINPHMGVVYEQLDDPQKQALIDMGSRWDQRDQKKESWLLTELANQLNVEEEDLAHLFYLVQIFPASKEQYTSGQLSNFFYKALLPKIQKTQTLSAVMGIKRLWQKFGNMRTHWNIDDLSMLLAIEKTALSKFLGPRDSYTKEEVTQRIEQVPNRTINDLEVYKTQKNSLRWYMNF